MHLASDPPLVFLFLFLFFLSRLFPESYLWANFYYKLEKQWHVTFTFDKIRFFVCLFGGHSRFLCVLVPWTGIEPRAPAVKAPSPNHWTTRKFPRLVFYEWLRRRKILEVYPFSYFLFPGTMRIIFYKIYIYILHLC